MKAFAAVVRREIVLRRGVLLTAVVAGIGAAAVNIFPFNRSWTRDVREAAALVAALSLAAGVSLLLGAFGLSRDIATRRIGFDLARPVSSFSLWAGRLGAAAVLTAGAAAIAALPTFLIHRGEVSAEIEQIFLSGVAIAVLLLLPIAHAAGIAFRSRSPWLAADVVLFLATVGIAAVSLRSPLRGMPPAAAGGGLIAASVLLAAAVLGAGFAAVAAGRTDIQAAHRAFSRVFWPAAFAAAALFAASAKWFVSVSPG